MNINIKATNIELSDAIRAYVEKRLAAFEQRAIKNPDNCHAEVEVGKTTEHHQSGDVFRAETVLFLNGKKFVAVCEKDDLYAAIDEMKDTLERKVLEGREKKRALWKRGAGAIKRLLRRE